MISKIPQEEGNQRRLREYTRSTASNEGRGEEGRGELAGCLGVRLTTGPKAFVAGAGQAGRQVNPTKGGASRQLSCTCTDSSATHGSTGWLIPGGRLQRRSNRKSAVALILS